MSYEEGKIILSSFNLIFVRKNVFEIHKMSTRIRVSPIVYTILLIYQIIIPCMCIDRVRRFHY